MTPHTDRLSLGRSASSQASSTKRPAVAAQIVGGELCFSKVMIRADYVDNVDIAIQRLLNGEQVWVAQVVSTVNSVQRTVEDTLQRMAAATKARGHDN